MSSNVTVYVGFWTNYENGKILGSTLTVTKAHGAILIATLAIFFQVCRILPSDVRVSQFQSSHITNFSDIAHRGSKLEYHLLLHAPNSSNHTSQGWLVPPAASHIEKQQFRF
jgi:hypothetical protein